MKNALLELILKINILPVVLNVILVLISLIKANLNALTAHLAHTLMNKAKIFAKIACLGHILSNQKIALNALKVFISLNRVKIIVFLVHMV